MADVSNIEKELLPFLDISARADLKATALQYFLGVTGTDEGCTLIANNDKYLGAVIALTKDQPGIAKDAFFILMNISTRETTSFKIVTQKDHPNFVLDLLKYALAADSIHADIVSGLLANITRVPNCAHKVLDVMIENKEDVGFEKLIQIFCKKGHNPNAKLHQIGPLLSNLTQIKQARQYVLDKNRCVIQRLLPFISFEDSLTRRGGVIGTIRNCCFETEYQSWLLSDEVDILPRLLLPLAGPEEFDDDDMDKLPSDLQYLDPDKKRETDPDLRQMLIETIYQLCATKECRLQIKDKNAYVIMRALYNWEKDPSPKAAAELLIGLLIGDEPEEGMENLREVEIPRDLQDKLQKNYEGIQREVEEDTRRIALGEEEEEPKGVVIMK